jgi:hypothetical protein
MARHISYNSTMLHLTFWSAACTLLGPPFSLPAVKLERL